MKQLHFFSFAIILVLLVALVASQRLVSRPTDITPSADQPSSDNEMGKTEAVNQLVAGFPQFSLYPDSIVVSSYEKELAGKKGYEAVTYVHADATVVFHWYLDQLAQQGWEIADQTEEGIGDMAITAQRNGERVGVFLDKEDDDDDPTKVVIEFPIQ